MSNSVKFSVDGETNADQVAGKVKASMGSIEKQVETIGMKFKNSFKDIFLSFLGPMALLGTAMTLIGKAIADNQQKREDANKAAIDGTNALMSAEDKYWANKRNNDKNVKKTEEEAKIERRNVTKEFLENDPRGRNMVQKGLSKGYLSFTPESIGDTGMMSRNKSIQDTVQALIAGDMKSNPSGPDLGGRPTSFSGPQGFSNVVGVGANAAMQAQLDQLEELRKQTMLLEQIATSGGNLPSDFTKSGNGSNGSTAPSRSAYQIK